MTDKFIERHVEFFSGEIKAGTSDLIVLNKKKITQKKKKISSKKRKGASEIVKDESVGIRI